MPAAVILCFCCLAPPDKIPDRPPPLTLSRHVDYIAWYNDLTRKPEKTNAFPIYRRLFPRDSNAADGADGTAEADPLPQLTDAERAELPKPGQCWTAKEKPLLAAYLQKHEAAIETFRQATDLPDYFEEFGEEIHVMYEMKAPMLALNRNGCRVLLALAMERPGCGADNLFKAGRRILRAGSQARQLGYSIGGLVCAAEQSLVYTSLRGALASGVLAKSDARDAYVLLRKEDPGSANYRLHLLVDWANVLDLAQFAFPDGKFSAENWRNYRSRMWDEAKPNSAVMKRLADCDLAEVLKRIDAYYSRMTKLADKPLRWKIARRMSNLYIDSFPAGVTESEVASLLNVVQQVRGYELFVRAESERRATMLTLALHIHHAKHGTWPAALDKIDPALKLAGLKTYCIDPFSGKPFRYTLKDGSPLLYSVGADGDDDGATHHPRFGEAGAGGDYVFWPFQTE